MIDRSEFDDLPGEVSVRVSYDHADYIMQNKAAVLVEQRFTQGVKYAACVPVSRAILDDATLMGAVLHDAVDRYLRPWKYPDRARWPHFILFPRLARLQAWVRRSRERLSLALSSLPEREMDPS